ncbi:hypothetical protein MRX96_055129 [Rhipicephalus microplus]
MQRLSKVCQLPFGVSVASVVFQRTMDVKLDGMPQAAVYLDDILIASEFIEEHNWMLAEVPQPIVRTSRRIQARKCETLEQSLELIRLALGASILRRSR